MRGREMRSRYIDDLPFLDKVSYHKQFYAYSLDGDRTYSSAVSFMTGFYPGGVQGPTYLY